MLSVVRNTDAAPTIAELAAVPTDHIRSRAIFAASKCFALAMQADLAPSWACEASPCDPESGLYAAQDRAEADYDQAVDTWLRRTEAELLSDPTPPAAAAAVA